MSDKIKSLKEEQVNLSPEKELKPYYVKITVSSKRSLKQQKTL